MLMPVGNSDESVEATRDSAEQLIHCLQPGDKDAQMVVYGHGVAQPIEIAPPLLAAWGGTLIGFNIARWLHALSANAKKMMAVMENITKLVRANKFTLDTAGKRRNKSYKII